MGVIKSEKDTNGEEYYRRTVEAASKLGYDFTAEEYKDAVGEYAKRIANLSCFLNSIIINLKI